MPCPFLFLSILSSIKRTARELSKALARPRVRRQISRASHAQKVLGENRRHQCWRLETSKFQAAKSNQPEFAKLALYLAAMLFVFANEQGPADRVWPVRAFNLGKWRAGFSNRR